MPDHVSGPETPGFSPGSGSFVRDENQLYELAFRTAQAFEDFKHIYYGYLKEVALAG